MKTIYFGGGCFWGVEKLFKILDDRIVTSVGYANSDTDNPTYEEVCSHRIQAIEAVKIEYDPKEISLEKLLSTLFLVVNPEQQNAQGNDSGYQYQVAIFYDDQVDYQLIYDYLEKKKKNYLHFYVRFEKLSNYYLAENDHQNYLDKNPNGYCHINFGALKINEN